MKDLEKSFNDTLRSLSKALEEEFIQKKLESGYLIDFKDYTISLSSDQIEKAYEENSLGELVLDEFGKEGLNFQDLKMDLVNKLFKD